MASKDAHYNRITKDDIVNAWQKSIEYPRKDWDDLVSAEPELAAELEIITGANATHDGKLDVEEKGRELRVASFVFGLLRMSQIRAK